MADTIRHRGPDDEGLEVLGQAGLLHRRLSIIDLSPAGHQPMPNEDRTVWIVFNGEIYNFEALRKELRDPHQFRSKTDTEVLLHLYEEQGPEMVSRLDGMFAFCILDLAKSRVLLARDHFGIKPLFYSLDEERLVFGSEIKPLLASGEVSREIDRAGLNDFFDFHWIPAPRSIFKQVRKLEPARVLELDLQRWQPELRRYWQPQYRPVEGRTLEDWAEEAAQELKRSVRSQLVADVPLGMFLSGGIDSTLITYFASKSKAQAVRTFTLDFEGGSHSESQYARQVSQRLQTDAVIRTLRCDSLDQLSKLTEFFDEPFADSSLLPTTAVSRAAREHVTVALSGDGGDELFSGYWHHKLVHWLSWMDVLPSTATRAGFGTLARLAPAQTRVHEWSRRFALPHDARRLSVLRLPARQLRLGLLSEQHRETKEARFWHLEQQVGALRGLPPVTQAQLYDLSMYLPNDMLVKVDRASMAVSLEVRVPLLSPRMADLAFRIPEHVRFRPSEEKRVLRHLVAQHFGKELAYRPKQGFSIPLKSWMREAASPEGCGRILQGGAVREGYLDGRAIQELFEDVRSGTSRWRIDRSDELFALMMFDAWWRRYRN